MEGMNEKGSEAGAVEERRYRVRATLSSVQLCNDCLDEDEGDRAPEACGGCKCSLLQVEVHAGDPEKGPQQHHE